MTNRRTFLAGMAASALPRLTWADAGSPAYLAAARQADGSFSLHGLTADGESRFALALPGRGHAACAHPVRPQAVAFARRPGTFAVVIDCATGAAIARLAPPEGIQFNGHGAFSADGAVLYTSEVVAEGSAGRIGLWDAARSYARIGAWASGGIGPHDIKRRTDGSLIVANGGIATDPDDRSKLNLDSMQPNLTRLSPDGAVLDQITLDPALHQNSIRHLALAPDGTVAFAMQWEGDAAEAVPLLGLWRPGTPPLLGAAAPQDALAMQGYAGSIAFAGDHGTVAITSAKGGAVMIFDRAGVALATHRRNDASGIAGAAAGFMMTDGNGGLWTATADGLTLLRAATNGWDNHLIALA